MPYIRHLEQLLGLDSDDKDTVILDARPITEEEGEHKKWYLMAKNVPSVDDFIETLGKYDHDYGTVCHAISAAAVAAAWRMTMDQGITGFQAGCIMWGFVQNWKGIKSPLRLMDFSNMLYPQYYDDFQRVMDPSTWDWLQKKAAKSLAEGSNNGHSMAIANGKVPFGWTVGG